MFKSTAKQAFKSAPTLARMYSDLPLSVKVTFPTGKSYDQPTGLFINNEFVLPKRTRRRFAMSMKLVRKISMPPSRLLKLLSTPNGPLVLHLREPST